MVNADNATQLTIMAVPQPLQNVIPHHTPALHALLIQIALISLQLRIVKEVLVFFAKQTIILAVEEALLFALVELVKLANLVTIMYALHQLHQNAILLHIHAPPAQTTQIVNILIQINTVNQVFADLANLPAILDAISSPHQGVILHHIHAPPVWMTRIVIFFFLPIPTAKEALVSFAKPATIVGVQCHRLSVFLRHHMHAPHALLIWTAVVQLLTVNQIVVLLAKPAITLAVEEVLLFALVELVELANLVTILDVL